MANACPQLISTRPETLLMQVQGYVIVAAAEAQGVDLIGELVRAGWMRLWETVHLPLGADADETASFFACGMLGNTLMAIGLSPNTGKKGHVARRAVLAAPLHQLGERISDRVFLKKRRVSACLPRRAGWPPWAR
jgi:hypothetical protein